MIKLYEREQRHCCFKLCATQILNQAKALMNGEGIHALVNIDRTEATGLLTKSICATHSIQIKANIDFEHAQLETELCL